MQGDSSTKASKHQASNRQARHSLVEHSDRLPRDVELATLSFHLPFEVPMRRVIFEHVHLQSGGQADTLTGTCI